MNDTIMKHKEGSPTAAAAKTFSSFHPPFFHQRSVQSPVIASSCHAVSCFQFRAAFPAVSSPFDPVEIGRNLEARLSAPCYSAMIPNQSCSKKAFVKKVSFDYRFLISCTPKHFSINKIKYRSRSSEISSDIHVKKICSIPKIARNALLSSSF